MQEVDATPITHVRIIIPLVHAMIEPESGVQIKHETQAAELRFMARVEQELFPLGSKRAPLLHVDDDVEWENNTFHIWTFPVEDSESVWRIARETNFKMMRCVPYKKDAKEPFPVNGKGVYFLTKLK